MKRHRFSSRLIDTEPVSFVRSYGVRKKFGFFAHFNSLFACVLATTLFIFLGIVFGMGIFAVVYMLGAIGIVITVVAILCIVWFGVLRVPRKRRKFLKNLKKACKKNGYILEFKRGFWAGLKNDTSGYDFTVKTKNTLWCARFFTCRRKASHLIFEDDHTITVRTNIVKNNIKLIYGLINTKDKRIEYSFDDPPPTSYMTAKRALIINPVPHTIFKKDIDGVVGATGSGEEMYGYTIFSGSGFIETLKR